MINSKIFSDLTINDNIQLESAFQKLFMNIDAVAGRRSILQTAGIDDYFINNLDFNLNINEFITILVSKFKNYSVSSRNPVHPLVNLLDYLLKQPERYNLDDEAIEIFSTVLSIGQEKLKAFVAPLPNINQQSSTIDVLIITALKDELDALKICDNDAGNSWQEYQDSLRYSYYKRSFTHINGSALTIAAASAVDMGENYTNNLATRLVSELKPRCLAMTGVCAGDRKKVFLGDVIVADRVFKFDYGKLVAYYQEVEGQKIRKNEIFHDITTYNLKPLWKSKIQNFSQDWVNSIQKNRPKSYFHQEHWLIHKIYDHQVNAEAYQRPQNYPERATECPDWRKVIERLTEQKLLKKDLFELTEKGIKEAENERLLHPDDERDQDPVVPKVHIGVIATTSQVQKDPELFNRLKKLQRKALGVEMEGAAIGAVSEIHEIPMIVVKGVQDYADYDKNDQFRLYAAETSARFLLAFLTTSSVLSR